MATKSKTPEEIAAAVDSLDADAKVARELLIAIGVIGYGEQWKALFAKEFGNWTGRYISRIQVYHWASGERAVPVHFREKLQGFGHRISRDLRERSDTLAEVLDPPKRKRTPSKPKDD